MKRDIFKKIIRQDLIYLLHKINIPTLIIWGTRDGYVPLSDGKKIARLIPNAKLEIIKNGKHGLHLQCPEKLLEVILRFTNY
ncbi:alpha/beta hydrolase [Patescibacteria group bacterium]|nr:alpha/beta hydrolase [Patescibacteria group bacterium]